MKSFKLFQDFGVKALLATLIVGGVVASTLLGKLDPGELAKLAAMVITGYFVARANSGIQPPSEK